MIFEKTKFEIKEYPSSSKNILKYQEIQDDLTENNEKSKNVTKVSYSKIFKSNDNLLNEMTDREYIINDKYIKKTTNNTKHKLRNNSLIENINVEYFESSANENGTNKYFYVDNYFYMEESYKKKLYTKFFECNAFSYKLLDNNKDKNKFFYTTSWIRDQSMLCKIKVFVKNLNYGKKEIIYRLYSDITNKFIMSAKKVTFFTKTVYYFTIDEESNDMSKNFLIGYLVSNFLGQEYNLYDLSEEDINININTHQVKNPIDQRMLGTIHYVIKVLFPIYP